MRTSIGCGVATIVASTLTVSAQNVWFTATTYDVAGAPRAVVAADFNNDGRPDVAAAAIDVNDSSAGGITVLSNNGDGTFTNRGTIQTLRGPFSLATADFNNDGAPDLAVVNADSNNLSVFVREKSTAFGFSSAASLATPGSPRGLAAGDLNRDGRPDLAITSLACSCVQALLGQGDGRFAAQASHAVAAGPTDIALGDLDRDGILDLATTANSGLTFLFGTGDGTFAARRDEGIGGFLPYSVTLADLNRNGKLDAAAAASAESAALEFDPSRAGSANGIAYSTGGTNTDSRDIAVADANGDGMPDVLVANRGAGTITILLGSEAEPMPVYQFIGAVPAAPGARALAVADFDLDGRPDLASANQYDGSVSILRNTSSFVGRR